MAEITDELREKALGIIPARVYEYEDKPFVIVEGQEELSEINQELNVKLACTEFTKWAPVYLKKERAPFSDLRLGHRYGSVQRSADLFSEEVRPPYTVPDGLIELEDICDWGFSDEYSTCCECEKVIRTSADCYTWTPDYWDSGDGYICGDCVREDPDDYLEDRVEKGLKGKLVSCNLVDPGEYGFELIASDLEHGLHEHQSDDPREIAKWAAEHGLEVVFVTRSSQFYQSFDVWMRQEGGDWVSDVKEVLFKSETSCLRERFRQYPTPADLMKQSMKAASAAGERFVKHHGDGTYTAYESAEEMYE